MKNVKENQGKSEKDLDWSERKKGEKERGIEGKKARQQASVRA